MCINKYIFLNFCMHIYEFLNLFAFILYILTVNIWNNCFDFFSSWDILTKKEYL